MTGPYKIEIIGNITAEIKPDGVQITNNLSRASAFVPRADFMAMCHAVAVEGVFDDAKEVTA